jgi:hypothetical protein
MPACRPLSTLAALPVLPGLLHPKTAHAQALTAPLASWNDGPAKQAIFDLVRATIDRSSPNYVPPEERIATFDQDGTLWVEHPVYTQVVYRLDRVPALAAKNPALKDVEPFKTVLSGNREAIAEMTTPDLEKVAVATLTGMNTEEFATDVRKWLETARHPRWDRGSVTEVPRIRPTNSAFGKNDRKVIHRPFVHDVASRTQCHPAPVRRPGPTAIG